MPKSGFSERMLARLWRLLSIAAFVLLPFAASAQSLNASLSDAFDLLNAGDVEGATQILDELKVDHPGNELIEYGLACALYAKSAMDYEGDNREMAEVGMEAAREKFEEFEASALPGIRRDARFNAANSVAHIARDKAREYVGKYPVVRPEDYATAESSSREAVAAYEEFLARYPGHEAAEINLNHARYKLKQVQQRQLAEEEQLPSDEDDEGDSGDDEEEGEEGEKGDEQEEGGENDKDDSDSGEDGKEPEDESGDTDDTGGGNETQADMRQNSLSRQNIEAILQSLEDIDREEQKELLRARTAPKVRDGQWW